MDPTGNGGLTLRCSCCSLPWLTISAAGVVRVTSRHRGAKHTNVISVEALQELVRAAAAAKSIHSQRESVDSTAG